MGKYEKIYVIFVFLFQYSYVAYKKPWASKPPFVNCKKEKNLKFVVYRTVHFYNEERQLLPKGGRYKLLRLQ